MLLLFYCFSLPSALPPKEAGYYTRSALVKPFMCFKMKGMQVFHTPRRKADLEVFLHFFVLISLRNKILPNSSLSLLYVTTFCTKEDSKYQSIWTLYLTTSIQRLISMSFTFT